MELQGKRVAILVDDQYEDLELWYPLLRLREAGAQVIVVGAEAAGYTSKHGIFVQADSQAAHLQANDFDALVISSCPALETVEHHPALAQLVHMAIQQGKVVAAVASVGQSLIAANGEYDERALRLFSLQEDVVTDGPYKDSAVIRAGNLIMARHPVNLPAFCRMVMAALATPHLVPPWPTALGQ